MLYSNLAIGVLILIAFVCLWVKIFKGSKSLFAYELAFYMAGYGSWFILFFFTTLYGKWKVRCSGLFFY